jgi:hypothetical protein
MDKSFCFFFQKEALSCFILHAVSSSFLKKRTKKLSSRDLIAREPPTHPAAAADTLGR